METSAKPFWAAAIGGVGMTVIALWQAVSTVSWPPEMPTSLPWTASLFGVFAYISFFSLLYENLLLKAPRLELVYEPANPSYVHDKIGVHGRTLRIFRVGVVNRGATAQGVSVKLVSCDPIERGAVYPGHEFWPVGQPQDVLSVTVHRSVNNEPMVFFEIMSQAFIPGQQADSHGLRYAAKGLYGRQLRVESQRIRIAIHGENAGPSMDLLIERDRDCLQWVMRRVG
jgi:hypothetical protein